MEVGLPPRSGRASQAHATYVLNTTKRTYAQTTGGRTRGPCQGDTGNDVAGPASPRAAQGGGLEDHLVQLGALRVYSLTLSTQRMAHAGNRKKTNSSIFMSPSQARRSVLYCALGISITLL